MKNNGNKKTGKISLTGSLASLAREVQNEEPTNKKETVLNKGNDDVLENKISSITVSRTAGKENFDEVINLAHELRNDPPKSSTVYVYENIKKDVEALKRIDGLENVPLTAILSAIIDDFLRNNTVKIKELLSSSDSRF